MARMSDPSAVTFVRLLILAALLGVAGCSPSPEEEARSPKNCEIMKDTPEAYERCLEELGN